MSYYCAGGFEARVEQLRQVQRFSGFEVMYYRTTLEDHSLMVSWTVGELLPYAERTFAPNFGMRERRETITQALVHDDPELRMKQGDVSAYLKSRMNDDERAALKADERLAIRELAAEFPERFHGFSYKKLLMAASRKDTVVAQLVSLADKITGFGEIFHELYAGNEQFIVDKATGNKPAEWYVQKFLNRKAEWPLLKPLFGYDHPFLNLPKKFKSAEIVKNGSPHTVDSLKEATGHAIYDKWREVILEKGEEKWLELLVKQREFSSS